MRTFSRFWIIALCAVAGASNVSFAKVDDVVAGTIEKTVDGDTLWVQAKDSWGGNGTRERLKIRMIGMDAPESHLPTPHGVVAQGDFGDKATEILADLAPIGTKVKIDDRGIDKYGRTLGRVMVGKIDVNLLMVEKGWAIPYIICEGPRCNEDFFDRENVGEYLDTCDSARSKRVGIFNPKKLLKEMPFEFRLRMGGRKPDKYVGDFETKELYKPADYDEVDLCNRIFFTRLMDAKRAGFTPTWRTDGSEK